MAATATPTFLGAFNKGRLSDWPDQVAPLVRAVAYSFLVQSLKTQEMRWSEGVWGSKLGAEAIPVEGPSFRDYGLGGQTSLFHPTFQRLGGSTRPGHPEIDISERETELRGGSSVQVQEGRATPVKIPYVPLIRALVENEQVTAARNLLHVALGEGLVEQELLVLREILTPPKVTSTEVADVDRSKEYRWLEAHRNTYRGYWVAVVDEELVAHARTLKEVLGRLKAISLARPPLVHRID